MEKSLYSGDSSEAYGSRHVLFTPQITANLKEYLDGVTTHRDQSSWDSRPVHLAAATAATFPLDWIVERNFEKFLRLW